MEEWAWACSSMYYELCEKICGGLCVRKDGELLYHEL